MTREDHASFTHIVESWLDSPDDFLDPDTVLDRAMEQVETKPQRRAAWPVWRIPFMNKFVTIGLAAAAVAVLVVAVIGSQLLGLPTNVGGGDATPTPQPTTPTPAAVTLASGSFSAPLGEFGEAFTIEAVRTGDDVSGTMEISNPAGGEGAYSVDVQCAGTTDDGSLLIGGEVTESTYEEFVAEGAYVVIALEPGTPVRMLWAVDALVTDEVPAPAESCSAFVETLLGDPMFAQGIGDHGRPIDGELELGE
jgi:hypothetical protein